MKRDLQKILKELREYLASQGFADGADGISAQENVTESGAVYHAEPGACVDLSDYDDFKDELKTFLNGAEKNETLFELVEMHLKKKGMKPSEVYRRAKISKQDFSRFVKPNADTISRSMVFNLAIGLQLDFKETKRLLRSVGYGFNRKLKFDLILIFCIDREIYDVDFINMLLEDFNQPLLKAYYYREK